jgi:saccharopine dehydrogenase-like NADP-dependent oxidoreductase
MNILVLGSGRVGQPMVLDLATEEKFKVSVADIDSKNIAAFADNARIKRIQADLGNPKVLVELIQKQDLIVNALPGYMGYSTCKIVIESGKNIVDIAFFPEDSLTLDAIAKKMGVTAIVDCGVAPGMSNLLIGYVANMLNELTDVKIMVGGLPVVRELPYEYRAVFSPIDVIEEYIRPARLIENGQIVIKEPFTDRELISFASVGTLEAFNTDGLRTLLYTIKCPRMSEKTLRYPGHVDKIILLKESGFFSQDTIEVGSNSVRPLDVTTRLLFPLWELKEGEEDFTVMRIIVEGKKNNQKVRYTYNLYDRYDSVNRVTSMARTTGYTATTAVRMISEGTFAEKGVFPPELIGSNTESVRFMLEGLKKKNIYYEEQVEEIN